MIIQNNTPIQMKWFYFIEGNKSKLNWFLFEFALEYYNAISKNPSLEDYRNQYDVQYIAQYCTYFSRRLKESLLKELRGRTKHVIFQERYINDFYPHHDSDLNHTLSLIAMNSFEELQFKCDECRQQCLFDYRAISSYFNEYKD